MELFQTTRKRVEYKTSYDSQIGSHWRVLIIRATPPIHHTYHENMFHVNERTSLTVLQKSVIFHYAYHLILLHVHKHKSFRTTPRHDTNVVRKNSLIISENLLISLNIFLRCIHCRRSYKCVFENHFSSLHSTSKLHHDICSLTSPVAEPFSSHEHRLRSFLNHRNISLSAFSSSVVLHYKLCLYLSCTDPDNFNDFFWWSTCLHLPSDFRVNDDFHLVSVLYLTWQYSSFWPSHYFFLSFLFLVVLNYFSYLIKCIQSRSSIHMCFFFSLALNMIAVPPLFNSFYFSNVVFDLLSIIEVLLLPSLS